VKFVTVWVCGLIAVGSAAATVATSSAQTSPPTNGATVAPAATPSPETEARQVEVKGFRSAMFGATEAEVRAAAIKDFGVAADAIRSSQNLAEHTQVLTVRAPDLLAEGGTADVAYSFGYKSKKLFQVGVTWSKQTDEKLTPERLLQNGESLRIYFQGAGYVPDSIVANVAVKDGVLLFRGAYSEGHTTILLLQGATTGEKAARQFSPSALVLLYVSDAKNPDVFRVPVGKF
jgi:hypothetical protein